jgi:uncharacterized protein (DUF1501 family)
MEHGDAADGSGWIARHLRERAGRVGSLTAVAIGTSCPESLRGAPALSVLESIDAYGLGRDDRALAGALAALHRGPTAIDRAGRDALATLERLDRVRGRAPASGAAYPDHPFGRGLAEVARLVKARAGLEVACVDLDGWDTHFVQATTIDEPLRTLGLGLAAFEVDLGRDRDDVVVVVMTEFGRRAYENASLGTDHGRASAMLVLGGGVRGGRVLGDWPGLGEEMLEAPGDLRVTTDYRAVLAELLGAIGNDGVGRVFPGLRTAPLGLFG